MPSHSASPSRDPVTIVWFKRDLRAADHAPLSLAAAAGRVAPLYIAEPEIWAQPSMSGRQWAFVAEALAELRADLARLGAPLLVRVGGAVEVLRAVAAETGARRILAHEETGDLATFARDRRVAAWARAEGVAFEEMQPAGVVRRLGSRDGWARRWDSAMSAPAPPPPRALRGAALAPGAIPEAAALGLAPDACPGRQRGGRAAGLAALDSFLTRRGRLYRKAMSSPATAYEACSRLSPHLAWGTLSSRDAAREAWARAAELKAAGARDGWRGSVDSFSARLHW